MVDGQGDDILNAVLVDELRKVRLPFQFPALLHPNLFHQKSTQFYHYASWCKENLQHEPKSAVPRRTSPG